MKKVEYDGRRYVSMTALAMKLGVHRSSVSRAAKYGELLRGHQVLLDAGNGGLEWKQLR